MWARINAPVYRIQHSEKIYLYVHKTEKYIYIVLTGDMELDSVSKFVELVGTHIKEREVEYFYSHAKRFDELINGFKFEKYKPVGETILGPIPEIKELGHVVQTRDTSKIEKCKAFFEKNINAIKLLLMIISIIILICIIVSIK
jgi:hypothetical protein